MPFRWSASCWKITAVNPKTSSSTDLFRDVSKYEILMEAERETLPEMLSIERQPSGPT